MIHHVAIATRDPATLAQFYVDTLGLTRTAEHRYDDGRVRSVWIDLGGGSILMLEHTDNTAQAHDDFATKNPGFHLLALTITKAERSDVLARLKKHGVHIEHETAYTLYVRDPDGNRLGFSHYPS